MASTAGSWLGAHLKAIWQHREVAAACAQHSRQVGATAQLDGQAPEAPSSQSLHNLEIVHSSDQGIKLSGADCDED